MPAARKVALVAVDVLTSTRTMVIYRAYHVRIHLCAAMTGARGQTNNLLLYATCLLDVKVVGCTVISDCGFTSVGSILQVQSS